MYTERLTTKISKKNLFWKNGWPMLPNPMQRPVADISENISRTIAFIDDIDALIVHTIAISKREDDFWNVLITIESDETLIMLVWIANRKKLKLPLGKPVWKIKPAKLHVLLDLHDLS